MTHFKNNLKKTAAITGLVLMTATPFASAANDQPLSKATQAKQGATVFSSILVGTAAGGPAGAFVGLLASAFIVDKIADADQLEQSQLDVAELEAQTASLRRELMAANEREQELETLAMNSLEFQVLFHTGQDTLSARGQSRIDSLAQFLTENPDVQVRLDGHADPRGTDEYNNVLSNYRAKNVADSLVSSGIEQNRIDSYAHGSSQSKAQQGNSEDYALERRVGIQVFKPQSSHSVVSVD